ncbi:MAG: amidohydrolase [Pseudorhodoplanes sp.]|nr:amidohydrolase [Pseudorhodoplanes sp.]
MQEARQHALAWIDRQAARISADHQIVWNLCEPAWREYETSRWYAERLAAEGFAVERGTAGMPTAFRARWISPAGPGPILASYAEYDAVPGNAQDCVPFRKTRADLHETAPGFIDPHSALGIGSLYGVLAAKEAIARAGLRAELRLYGEPAENMCGGKPMHAAHGFYDDLDAVIGWRPAALRTLANTCVWDTHCGCYWSRVYTFTCDDPGSWGDVSGDGNAASHPHVRARTPGALDALCLMYTTTKYSKEAMLPHAGSWSVNEAILSNASTTANNQAPRFAQIQYSWRAPDIAMAERILSVLENNARHVAALTHTTVRGDWISRTRPGLPNHALAEIVYANMQAVGAPRWNDGVADFANACLASAGRDAPAEPFAREMSALADPRDAERALRATLPPWQTHYTSDDYVEYTWHAPTVKFLVGRARLADSNPSLEWINVALGGLPEAIDPTIVTAAKVIASTIVELAADPASLKRSREEFNHRTGGGIGGASWIAPLMDTGGPSPASFAWPDYARAGERKGWIVPVTAGACD